MTNTKVATVNMFGEMVKWYTWGFLSFPVAYYFFKTMGGQIWTDIKDVWTKFFTKAKTDVTAEVAKVA